MDDFEYSVEISDRDWKTFFAECEECSLLPPSLAGVDDSGMSDMDEHFRAQRMPKVHSTPNFSENDFAIDGPLNGVGSPVEHCLGKQGLGVDSILSGSEEDIHMQSVNIFFETLKGLTEVQSGQERVGNNKGVKQEQGRCGDGQQASRRTCPTSKALHDRVEIEFGKETIKPVDATGKLNAKKIAEAESISSSKPVTCSNSAFSICKTAETELFIRNETLMETQKNEKTQWNQLQNSHERTACSDMTPPAFNMETCRSMDDVTQEGLLKCQEILCAKCSLRKDHSPTQELSPSVSMKRKRRKKKRLSVEAGEDEESSERHVSAKWSDTKEELRMLKEGGSCLCFSRDTFNHLKEPSKELTRFYTSSAAIDGFPGHVLVQDSKDELLHSVSPNDSQNHQSRSTEISSAENHSTNRGCDVSQNDADVTSAASNRAHEATNLQACNKVQTEESAGTETFKSQGVKTSGLQFDRISTSVINCANEHNLKHSAPEVKSVILPCEEESCAAHVEVIQIVTLSAAKSVLAADAGNSGRAQRVLCESEVEPQQQMENGCHNTNHGHTPLENTRLSVSSPQPRKCSLPDEISAQVTCTDLKPNCINQPSISSLSEKQTKDCPTETHTSDILSEKPKKEKNTQLKPSQILNLTSQSPETNVPLTEDLNNITNVPYGCTLDTKAVISNTNENLADAPASLCSSASKHKSIPTDQNAQILSESGKDAATSGTTNQTEPKSDFSSKAEETVTASKDLDRPEKTESSVFAMSSFWNDMEKLTINDILRLKKLSKAAPPGILPAVQESDEAEMFPVANSDVFTPMEESKSDQTPEETINYSSLKTVSWESAPGPVSLTLDQPGSDIYSESVSDSSQPVLTETAQKRLRKIAKTVSVHNLQALESKSFNYTCIKGAAHILEQQTEEFDYLTENAAPLKDEESSCLPSSCTESYSISFTDIFQYLFGGKPSVSSQSASDDTTSDYTSGSSVPETYDHFFSEFDSESFFYPLTTAEEEKKDKSVPIYSCSRSTTKGLQFPEAYEHFFASSSSDDSSVESEEEDNCSPVKVVSRFTRKASSTQLSKDMYEDFFTDRDLREDFFSLKSLSFRKFSFPAPADQNQTSNALVPTRKTHSLKIGAPLNVMGDQDVMFPNPLLYNLEDRICRQLAQQPFRYGELQAAVSDPSKFTVIKVTKRANGSRSCTRFCYNEVVK